MPGEISLNPNATHGDAYRLEVEREGKRRKEKKRESVWWGEGLGD